MIYCDHNATTPLRPGVLEAMLPYLREDYGNASSAHQLGSRARCAVEEARAEVAALIGATAAEIVFTSGGTESNNLAINGAARALQAAGRPAGVATTAIEHSSVLEPVETLADVGWQRTDLELDADGRIHLEEITKEQWSQWSLLSIGWANNEIGAIQPISALGRRCREHSINMHCDATQAVGKVKVGCQDVDLLSVSAHKLGGPKGVGALFVRSGVAIEPLFRGGGQERERRAGTENVAGIVGFGAACRLAAAELETQANFCRTWSIALWDGLRAIPGTRRNSPTTGEHLPNTLNVSFEGVRGEALVAALDLAGVAVSSGSACAAGAGEPSHVLLALGRSMDEARNGVRFSCGRNNEMSEIGFVVEAVRAAVERIRTA